MRIRLSTDIRQLSRYLPRFLSLMGLNAWRKREASLVALARGTNFQSHLVHRYHWLELEIARLRLCRRASGTLSARMEGAATASALRFAAAAVEIEARLGERARMEWRGRLRDALKADCGFAPVYLEAMHAANTGIGQFDVSMVDLEKLGRHDMTFSRRDIRFNIECKHVSGDSGRRIHQRDFYRVMGAVYDILEKAAPSKPPSTILITLDDRLPADDASVNALVREIRQSRDAELGSIHRGTYFNIEKRSTLLDLGAESVLDHLSLQRRVQAAYGDSCHAVTTGDHHGRLTIVMRSRAEDDHSKPLLQALKSAYKQLPTDAPGYISVQVDDLSYSELTYDHVLTRFQRLSMALLCTRPAEHVAGVLFTTFRPASGRPDNAWNPMVVQQNPNFREDWKHKYALPFGYQVTLEQARFQSTLQLDRSATNEEFNALPSSASYRRRSARLSGAL